MRGGEGRDGCGVMSHGQARGHRRGFLVEADARQGGTGATELLVVLVEAWIRWGALEW